MTKSVVIVGAGKAGATQSPLLALHVAHSLELDINNRLQEYMEHFAESGRTIDRGLRLLAKDFEPDNARK